jgi:hypothetical protein
MMWVVVVSEWHDLTREVTIKSVIGPFGAEYEADYYAGDMDDDSDLSYSVHCLEPYPPGLELRALASRLESVE